MARAWHSRIDTRHWPQGRRLYRKEWDRPLRLVEPPRRQRGRDIWLLAPVDAASASARWVVALRRVSSARFPNTTRCLRAQLTAALTRFRSRSTQAAVPSWQSVDITVQNSTGSRSPPLELVCGTPTCTAVGPAARRRLLGRGVRIPEQRRVASDLFDQAAERTLMLRSYGRPHAV